MQAVLETLLEKVNAQVPFTGKIAFNEPLSEHCTFKVGGPADLWVRPDTTCFADYAAVLMEEARARGIAVFVLGGGANIVPHAKGFRGVVLDCRGHSGLDHEAEGVLCFRAGTVVDAAVELALERGLGGLEFLAGLPGTIGGAVYMNARCYGKSVSDVLLETTVLGRSKFSRVPRYLGDFAYKKSPFQNNGTLIIAAKFAVQPRDPALIKAEMQEHRHDREAKGHYRFPSAGSVFKNNPAFGKPTGKLIDELGLRGLTCGGAMVATFHGNIIVNTGGATPEDLSTLTKEVQRLVFEKTGFDLEPEIIFLKEK